MSDDEAPAVERWWQTLGEHASHGRCPEWVHAYTSLIQTDHYLEGPPPNIDRPQTTTGGTRSTT